MTSSSSTSPKKPSATSEPPKRITRSMLKFLNSHKSTIPNIVYRQTARMRTMTPGQATKGKQLAPHPIRKETPPTLKPTHDSMKKILSSRKGRRNMKTRTIKEESSDDDMEEGLGENYFGDGGIDESDEEERGDKDRKSFDEADDGSTRSSDTKSFAGSDNDEYIARDDGYDSDF